MALTAIEAAEQSLLSAVADARANKRSWTEIANVLGVSRQAARQRFDERVAACLTSKRTLGRRTDAGPWRTNEQK
jgi:predicted ArsR family transcriptional regulator